MRDRGEPPQTAEQESEIDRSAAAFRHLFFIGDKAENAASSEPFVR